MTKLNVYSAKGVKKSSVSLPKRFSQPVNKILLAQAIRVYEDRRHPGLSKTKTRSEITASTRKIWRQKGTGKARHGARSAPIFVGGGIAHGPKGVKRELALPKKMRQKALSVALSLKAKEGKILLVDGISSLKKTKEAATLLKKIVQSEKEVSDNSRFTFVLSGKNSEAKLALRNLKNVEAVQFGKLNTYQVYFGGVLVIDRDGLKTRRTAKRKSVKSVKKTA